MRLHSLKVVRRQIKRLVDPVPRCYGPEFQKRRKLLAETQWWDRARLEEHQNCELRALAKHCYANVPYYRQLFRTLGIGPDDIRCKEDLQRLPLLDKDTIRANADTLLAGNIPRRR